MVSATCNQGALGKIRMPCDGMGMAEVPSTFTLQAGAIAPDFVLPDGNGVAHALNDLTGSGGTVVAFLCNHCPFVIHLACALGRFADELAPHGVVMIGINSNDVENYPADAPDKMVEFTESHGWRFPYLYDETQEVARAYDAACTPDFFLFDGEGRLFYAGQFDESRPGKGEPDGADMREAVRRMLLGEESPQPWRPSSGCNIKWK